MFTSKSTDLASVLCVKWPNKAAVYPVPTYTCGKTFPRILYELWNFQSDLLGHYDVRIFSVLLPFEKHRVLSQLRFLNLQFSEILKSILSALNCSMHTLFLLDAFYDTFWTLKTIKIGLPFSFPQLCLLYCIYLGDMMKKFLVDIVVSSE